MVTKEFVAFVERPLPSVSADTDARSDDGVAASISDVYEWAFAQADHIRKGRFDSVDRINIADEVEDVGKRELRGFVNELMVVLLHMLKWDHQEIRRSRSWVFSIKEHRSRFQRRLEQSPSLKAKRDEAIAVAYDYARGRAISETDLPEDRFPDICPYSWDEINGRFFALEGK